MNKVVGPVPRRPVSPCGLYSCITSLVFRQKSDPLSRWENRTMMCSKARLSVKRPCDILSLVLAFHRRISPNLWKSLFEDNSGLCVYVEQDDLIRQPWSWLRFRGL